MFVWTNVQRDTFLRFPHKIKLNKDYVHNLGSSFKTTKWYKLAEDIFETAFYFDQKCEKKIIGGV